MLDIDNATRDELETAAVCEPGLYEAFNEERLLGGKYSTDELRDIIRGWIVSDPDVVVD